MKFKLYILLGLCLCSCYIAKAQKVDSVRLLMDIYGVNVAATTTSDDAVPITINTYNKVSWGDGFGTANRALIQALRNKVLLPITLSKFNAKKDADAVKVSWATSAEKNASHFEIYRSADGEKFERIATVGAKGDSDELLNYSYRDTKPSNGTNYYQLKSVDKDGTFTTSIVVAVQFDLYKTDITVVANAANQRLKLNVYSPANITADFLVSDMNGRVLLNVKKLSLQKGANVFEYKLNVPQQLLIAVLSSEKEKSAFKFYY